MRSDYLANIAQGAHPGAVLHVLVFDRRAPLRPGPGPHPVDEPELRDVVGKHRTVDTVTPSEILAWTPPGFTTPIERDDKGRACFPAFLLRSHRPQLGPIRLHAALIVNPGSWTRASRTIRLARPRISSVNFLGAGTIPTFPRDQSLHHSRGASPGVLQPSKQVRSSLVSWCGRAVTSAERPVSTVRAAAALGVDRAMLWRWQQASSVVPAFVTPGRSGPVEPRRTVVSACSPGRPRHV